MTESVTLVISAIAKFLSLTDSSQMSTMTRFLTITDSSRISTMTRFLTLTDSSRMYIMIRSVLSPLTDIVGHSNTGYSDRYCSGQILDSYRLESDLPAGGQNGIDMSKSMGQLLESLEDLNQNIRSGFNIMAVCTDYGRQTMHDHMSVHDDILSRLEQSLFTSKPYIEKTQADSLELRRNQDRVYSDLNLQEKTVSNLNQELLVLSEKT